MKNSTHAVRRPLLAGALLLFSQAAFSAEQTPTLTGCARIADNAQRLACYDRLAAQQNAPEQPQTASTPEEKPAPFSLARHWELEAEYKRGTFAFRPHRDNYVLFANYNSAPNDAPFSPIAGLAPQDGTLSHTEVKFQLGFKLKLLEDVSSRHSDLWFGYTQDSYWQAYNRQISSAFRETNYQPELMFVTPVDFNLLGMRARFVNLGLVHQSNGRAEPLSRSWNRIYAQLGMENGNFVLAGRIWKRLSESAADDDNPDILDYMGYGDISGTYRWRGHEFSALFRHNFRTGRGATQVSWAFPLTDRLKGYIQAFSGYGQSLIDYNYSQRAIGIGVLVAY